MLVEDKVHKSWIWRKNILIKYYSSKSKYIPFKFLLDKSTEVPTF